MRRALLVLMVGSSTIFAIVIQDAHDNNGVSESFVPGLQKMVPAEIDAVRDPHGKSLLHIAAARKHQIRLFALLAAGADVNATDSVGRTAVHDLLDSGDLTQPELTATILELLTLSGANINAVSRDGWSPLAYAVRNGDFASAEYLLWLGADPNPAGVPRSNNPTFIAEVGKKPDILHLFQDPKENTERFARRQKADVLP